MLEKTRYLVEYPNEDITLKHTTVTYRNKLQTIL
jgi:hypothetical protein